jgi:hypothetical protein
MLDGGVKHFAGEALGCQVHLFGRGVVEDDVAVFGEGEGLGWCVVGLHGGGGEAEPAVVDAEGDFVGAYFDYGVVGAVESVGGCVAAEQGCPGGPEFGVEAIVHGCPNGESLRKKKIPKRTMQRLIEKAKL